MKKFYLFFSFVVFSGSVVHATIREKSDSLETISGFNFGVSLCLPYLHKMEGTNVLSNKANPGLGGGVAFIYNFNHWALSTGINYIGGTNTFSISVNEVNRYGTILPKTTLPYEINTVILSLPTYIQYKTNKVNNIRYFTKFGLVPTARAFFHHSSPSGDRYIILPTSPSTEATYLAGLFEVGGLYYITKKTSLALSIGLEKAFFKFHQVDQVYLLNGTEYTISTLANLPLIRIGILF